MNKKHIKRRFCKYFSQ